MQANTSIAMLSITALTRQEAEKFGKDAQAQGTPQQIMIV